MNIFADYTELYIAIVGIILAVLFHFIILRGKCRSNIAYIGWDVFIFLVSFVGISVIYYSALSILMSP